MPGVKDWIKKASEDLKCAKKLIKEDDETLAGAAYFTQQSAEKALKSYLIFKQQTPLRTHDLEKLLTECSNLNNSFIQLRNDVKALATYATYTRYPDNDFRVDREEVIEAITHAGKILKFVKAKIEPPTKNQQLDFFN